MKFQHFQIIIFIFVMCLCFKIGYPQNKAANKKSNSFDAKDIVLKIKNLKSKIVGKIEIKILLKNNSSSVIGMPYIRQDRYGGFEVEVTDSKGILLERVKDPKEKLGFSRSTIELRPKDKVVATIFLTDFYKLEVGKYRVKVK